MTKSMDHSLTISEPSGPFREPREPVFSYDYAIQRATWATPHGVRVKVSIPSELDVLKVRLLDQVAGSPGQQLIIGNVLSRKIADWKLRIAEAEGMLAERRDVKIEPYTGALAHLFPKLSLLFEADKHLVREEVRRRVGL
jgi:hypothetical protein